MFRTLKFLFQTWRTEGFPFAYLSHATFLSWRVAREKVGFLEGSVLLSGIRFRVDKGENRIVFTEDFSKGKIVFNRDSKLDYWRVALFKWDGAADSEHFSRVEIANALVENYA